MPMYSCQTTPTRPGQQQQQTIPVVSSENCRLSCAALGQHCSRRGVFCRAVLPSGLCPSGLLGAEGGWVNRAVKLFNRQASNCTSCCRKGDSQLASGCTSGNVHAVRSNTLDTAVDRSSEGPAAADRTLLASCCKGVLLIACSAESRGPVAGKGCSSVPCPCLWGEAEEEVRLTGPAKLLLLSTQELAFKARARLSASEGC